MSNTHQRDDQRLNDPFQDIMNRMRNLQTAMKNGSELNNEHKKTVLGIYHMRAMNFSIIDNMASELYAK
jgi:hypothetical protein